MSNHESVISLEYYIPVIHNEEPHVHNPEEDNNVVTRKGNRHRIAKSFENDIKRKFSNGVHVFNK